MTIERPNTPDGVPREVTAHEARLLSNFIALCLELDISFNISFDTGRYIPGNLALDQDGKLLGSDEIPQEDIIQGPQGIEIEVASFSVSNKDGQKLYPNLYTAINDGLQMLFYEAARKYGEEFVRESFGKYFRVG